MQIHEILLTAVALAMDAFAVAICKGLATREMRIRHALIVGLWFGGFQALMPVLGYLPVRLLGPAVEGFITSVDHWVSFALLAFIGGKMIYEALVGGDECVDCSLGVRTMLVMALATSVDALAVGITFALTNVNIVFAALAIGVITFALSALGVKIGNVFGAKYKHVAELAGGITLVLLGVKMLLDNYGLLPF